MKSHSPISRLRRSYFVARTAETFLFAAAVALTAAALARISIEATYAPLVVAVAAGLLAFMLRFTYLRLSGLTDERMAFYLNARFPSLQESSDLLTRPSAQMSAVEQIQTARVTRSMQEVFRDVRIPHRLMTMLLFSIASGALFVAATKRPTPAGAGKTETTATHSTSVAAVAANLIGYKIQIQPPAYTKLRPVAADELTPSFAENSQLTWHLRFDGKVESAWLSFTSGDSVHLFPNGDDYVATRNVSSTLLYQVKWRDQTGSHTSDYFKLTARADQVPHLEIKSLEQFTRLGWGERKSIRVPAELTDDYGIARADIVATVSKGSGESIKFREERLSFTSPQVITGKKINAYRDLDFQQLGMEPGDEVYFYVEAWDNKTPGEQHARTETFFIALQDTASQVLTVDSGLGVDLMPEYFRSQRQLIIDTEKLLREQPRITKTQFNSTSNELGYDQKVLRLRYGQFLGEEFETAIGEGVAGPPVETEEDKELEDKDVAAKFGHQHDKGNEHNLVAEKKQPATGHDHDGEEEEDKDPIAAFKHSHDKMDEATFFTQSVRTKLKAALTLMWDSELQLRLYHPRESLPTQYKILSLLKEISQDSRVYVHRMGFDPPPLKEEKRLTGDLDEISDESSSHQVPGDLAHPAIRQALETIGTEMQSAPFEPSEKLRAELSAAGVELAAIALEQPGNLLGQLSNIRKIIDGNVDTVTARKLLQEIQIAFWSIVPREERNPGRTSGMRHKLDVQMLQELKKATND